MMRLLSKVLVVAVPAAAFLAGPSPLHAQVPIYTSMLQSGSNTFVCKVTNLNTANIAPCIYVLSKTGSTLASNCPSVAPQGAGEATYTATASTNAYCKATFASSTEADNSRVNIILRDSSGNDYASLRAPRTGISTGATVITASLDVGYPNNIACRVVNTDSSAQTVNITLYDDSGTVEEQVTNVSIPAANATWLFSAQPTYPNGTLVRHCEVDAGSTTEAKLLRVAISVRTDNTSTPPLDSYAPVEGF
jgi:hypothetical protein